MDIINIDNYLRINLTDMTLILISTTLIIVFVRVFFWKNVKQYLDKRQAVIQDSLDGAKVELEKSEAIKAEYEAKMRGAREEANELMNNAKLIADTEAHDIITHAKEDATAIRDRAYQDMSDEKIKMVRELKKESSDVAFEVAKKLLEKEVNEEVRKRYVDEFMTKTDGE
ncbi:MAG: F0F1 ATP synthase subunit B [Breznakia sp.]